MGSNSKIPVVDMGQLAVGREESGVGEVEWRRVSEKLLHALSAAKPVYLLDHGIDTEQIKKAFEVSAALFSLPLEAKEAYTKDVTLGHGYVSNNREKVALSKWKTEVREAYDVKSLEAPNPSFLIPSIAPVLASCKTLTHRILAALALGLGLERDYFEASHQQICNATYTNSSVLRLLHYPPFPAVVPENTIRCGEHTDYGTFTLLFQDSIGGLQVRGKDGQWVDAEPIPDAILLIAGDLLQLWAAKRMLATEHRVIIPKKEAHQRVPRYSIAFFVHPDDEVLVAPLDGSTHPPPVKAGQYLRNMLTKIYSY